MVTIRKCRRSALVVMISGTIGSTVVFTAAPAFAENMIDVTGVGPVNIGVEYSCERSAGVTAIAAMVGAPDADRPAATGKHGAVRCDGARHNAVIMLTGGAVSAGETVQIRVALVDRNETVVAGQAKVMSPR